MTKSYDEITNDEIDDLVDEWHIFYDGNDSLLSFLAAKLNWTEQDVQQWINDARYRPTKGDLT